MHQVSTEGEIFCNLEKIIQSQLNSPRTHACTHAYPVTTRNCSPQIEKRELPSVNGGGFGARVRTAGDVSLSGGS